MADAVREAANAPDPIIAQAALRAGNRGAPAVCHCPCGCWFGMRAAFGSRFDCGCSCECGCRPPTPTSILAKGKERKGKPPLRVWIEGR